MSVPVLEALLAGDTITAMRLLECDIPSDVPLNAIPLAVRLNDLRLDPSLQPWLLRAMVDRPSGVMVGHIGFHSPPCPQYLARIVPDAVELGYTVYPRHRRRGYAAEAALSLMHWAYDLHGQRCFFLSVAPQNLASTAMAESLGFTRCGSHIDDEDGLEIEYVRRIETWPAEWRLKQAG
jgi:RimJ/RimL family protein N-acetyltransferase